MHIGHLLHNLRIALLASYIDYFLLPEALPSHTKSVKVGVEGLSVECTESYIAWTNIYRIGSVVALTVAAFTIPPGIK